ncbi:hypothetical protein JNB11_00100 [Kocuria palustris]|nr:hypothetical protein [Kocuria palustris]
MILIPNILTLSFFRLENVSLSRHHQRYAVGSHICYVLRGLIYSDLFAINFIGLTSTKLPIEHQDSVVDDV